MGNIFDEINQKLDTVLTNDKKILDALEGRTFSGNLIPWKQFCKDREIVPQTGYNWEAKGLFKTEKIGGLKYVIADSIRVVKKFQREPLGS